MGGWTLAPPRSPAEGAGCHPALAPQAEAKQSPSPPHVPPWGTGRPVPGLALPPGTELLDRFRTGQDITVAIIHLDAIIANTQGKG